MGAQKRVLVIGLEPAFADLTPFPGLTPEKIRAGLQAAGAKLQALGYQVKDCLVVPDEKAADVVAEVLTQEPFDCIVIGAGVRNAPQQFLLFERLINVVHAKAPTAKICFNTQPADTAEAVQRWL